MSVQVAARLSVVREKQYPLATVLKPGPNRSIRSTRGEKIREAASIQLAALFLAIVVMGLIILFEGIRNAN